MAKTDNAAEPALGTDSMNVVHPQASGLDVHKMQITVSLWLAQPRGDPLTATREFSALPRGLRALTDWLLAQGVSAAGMEATGIFWKAPFEAQEDAGIEPLLYHARFVQQVKGKKSDVADSLWLARITHFPGPLERLPARRQDARSVAYWSVCKDKVRVRALPSTDVRAQRRPFELFQRHRGAKNSRDVVGSLAGRESSKNTHQPNPQNLNHVMPVRNSPRVGTG